MKLEVDPNRGLLLPDAIPASAEDLLDLMDQAATSARKGQGSGAPAFDHGMRVFEQLQAHYQLKNTRELGQAHQSLRKATDALRAATWLLALVTVLLAGVEVFKFFSH